MLSELVAAVRERRVSAVELVRTSLERIERLDPPLNAVVALRAEEALAEAGALDSRVAAGEDPGPLAGVPLLVKDCEDLVGIRTTWGSLLRRDAPPADRDGLVPRRLRAAGAIPVGKTNVPEFTAEGFTANPLFGPTRNPWALEWSPGGSSGGSAAALAAGMAAIATATDGGGSVRIPAAFCGLAGLKPTNGVIPRDPIPPWMDLSTDGPLATSVADLELLLSIEAGPVPGDPTALPLQLLSSGELPSRVLASPRFVNYGPLPEGVERSFRQALRGIERDLGLPIEPVDPEAIFRAGNPDVDWHTICSVEHLHLLGRETVESNLDVFGPPFRGWMERALLVTVDEYLQARRQRFEYVRELDTLLGTDAVIVTPTMCEEGFLADGTLPRLGRSSGSQAYNTNIQNLCGVPAISVPAGVSANGVPFGLQFTGPRFRDDLVLAIAAACEETNPWPLSAPGHEPFLAP